MKNILKMTDKEIVDIVTKKDKELYSEIVKRYEEKLLRYAGYLVSDSHLAADIVQESFIKAYINLNGFDRKKKFSSWIYRIVHNEAMNAVKKQKKHSPIYENIDLDSGINLEDKIIIKEMKGKTHKCLSRMPVIYKEPLSLFYLEEKSYEEISDILRIPIGTVGTRVNRAKILMKKICQK